MDRIRKTIRQMRVSARNARPLSAQSLPEAPRQMFSSVPPMPESGTPPDYTPRRVRWLQASEALKVAMIFLIVEGLYRFVVAGHEIMRASKGATMYTVASMLFAGVELMSASFGIYLAGHQERPKNWIHIFSATFAALSVLLVPVLVLGFQEALRRTDILHKECQIDPPRYGIRITLDEARRLCDQRVTTLRIAGLLMDLSRVVVQIIIIRVVYNFTRYILYYKHEGFVMRSDQPQYDTPSSLPRYRIPSQFEAAPIYQAALYQNGQTEAAPTTTVPRDNPGATEHIQAAGSTTHAIARAGPDHIQADTKT